MDDSGGTAPYQRVDELVWSVPQLQQGKQIKMRGFPSHKKVKLFRVIVSTNRTDFVVTNDLSQAATDAVQDVCSIRWKIEESHREVKQLTGVEACQCRKARIQRNHIACALLVWSRLKTIAYKQAKPVISLSMICSQITSLSNSSIHPFRCPLRKSCLSIDFTRNSICAIAIHYKLCKPSVGGDITFDGLSPSSY